MFTNAYHFKRERAVVLQHIHGAHLRVSPRAQQYLDGNGGTGKFARWKIHLLGGGTHVKLQNMHTGKYLRIWNRGNDIDCGGGGGQFTKFKIHYHSRPNGVKLESDRFYGRYIAMKPNRSIKIGTGGKHCVLYFLHDGRAGHQHQTQTQTTVIVQKPAPQVIYQQPATVVYQQPPQQQQQPQVFYNPQPSAPSMQMQPQMQRVIQQPMVVPTTTVVYEQPPPPTATQTVITTTTVAADSSHQGFNGQYHFKRDTEVVVRGIHGRTLRVNPQLTGLASGDGGYGNKARWKVHLQGNGVCKLQSMQTGRYLRIYNNGRTIDVGGNGGQWTLFRTNMQSFPNVVKLESVRLRGKYVALKPNGECKVGSGGKHCVMTFLKKSSEKVVVHEEQRVICQPVQVVQQVVQPSVQVFQQPVQQQQPYVYQQQYQQQQPAQHQQPQQYQYQQQQPVQQSPVQQPGYQPGSYQQKPSGDQYSGY